MSTLPQRPGVCVFEGLWDPLSLGPPPFGRGVWGLNGGCATERAALAGGDPDSLAGVEVITNVARGLSFGFPLLLPISPSMAWMIA